MPTLVGKEIGPYGFGLMGLSCPPTPVPGPQAFATLREALQQGANFWNGGEFYGTPSQNSLTLLRAYFTQYPADAAKVVLSIKGGLDETRSPRGKPADVRASVENCVRLLAGTKKIDIFECARVDRDVPIEETMGELNKLVDEGLIGAIGLSEAGPDTIRRAAAVASIAAVETEVSLFEDQAFTRGTAAACAELGIPIVAYSPFGRGFLTGQVKGPGDLNFFQQRNPRYQGENFGRNMELVRKVEGLAGREGVSPAQYSLAWIAAQGEREGMPVMIPIPGATTVERVKENFDVKRIGYGEFGEIDGFLETWETAGLRYPAEHMDKLD